MRWENSSSPNPVFSRPISLRHGRSLSSEEDDAVNANQLACWAPLLLTFSSSKTLRLCPRRDSGGRCPIHGRIVPRDPVTGRPVNPFDREQLQAEVVAMRQAKLEGNCLLVSLFSVLRKYFVLK